MPDKFVGTAPKANFWLLRTEQGSSEYLIEEFNYVCGSEFADSVGVDIIHSSLGYNDFDNESTSYKYSDMDGNTAISTIGADISAAKGIIVVTSAGNEGSDPWKYISAPADGDSVLAIGAVNSSGKYAYFSSQGPSYDLRIKPDVVAQGLFATVQGTNGNISSSNGTSFSGPIVAGMVACLKQAHMDKSNMEIINAIKMSGSQYTTPDGKLGFGIPDFNFAHLYLSGISFDNLNNSNKLMIFPNPFNEGLNIEIYTASENLPSKFQINIFDILGKNIFTKEISETETNYSTFYFDQFSCLENGTYIIQVVANNESYNRLVVKE